LKNIKNLSKVIIIAILVAMIITVAYPIIVLGANEKNLPVITPMQRAGEIRAGQELKFKITDDTKVSYIFYAWNRRTDGGKSTCIELEKEEPEYEFKINAPTQPGLYEFSIAAEDYYGNTTYWMNIPYIITNNLSGEQDNTAPEFIFNTPNEYPYNDSTIPQEMPITIRAKDPSGIYYIGYKWTRELETKVTGATLVYKKDTVQITAPKEQGVWYLILYARDGSNNLSECYYTRVTVKDQIAPTLTLNGKAEVDVPLNGTFTDEGATFSDNCDATKIVYANEKVDTSKVGEQILTYTATDNAGNVSNTVTRKVTVVAPYKTYELTAPTKTEYKVGDKIDLTGANIKVIDERGNISNVTPTEDMFTGFSTQSVGSKEATFTYEGTSIKYKYEVKALKYDMSGVKFTGTEATYDGTAHNIAVDETTLPEGVTVTGYIGNGQTSAGEHKVKVTFEGDENHEKIEDIEVTLKITPKTITVIAEDKSSEYGAENLEELTARLAVAGDSQNGEDYTNNILVGEDTLESIGVLNTLTTTATTSVIGDYPITGTDGKYGNYTVTVIEGTYKITKKIPTINELTYNLPASKMYNGKERPIKVNAKQEIEGLGKITIKYNGETTAPINSGEYKVTAYNEARDETLTFEFAIDYAAPLIYLVECDYLTETPMENGAITSAGMKVIYGDNFEVKEMTYVYRSFSGGYEKGTVNSGFIFYRKGEYTITVTDMVGNTSVATFTITDYDLVVDPEGAGTVGTEVTENGGAYGDPTMSVGYTRCIYLGPTAPSQSRLQYTFTS